MHVSIEPVRRLFFIAAGFAALCQCSEKYGTVDSTPQDAGSDAPPSIPSDGSVPPIVDAAQEASSDAGVDASDAATVNREPELIHAGLGNPSGIALDTTHIYVTLAYENAVVRFPKAGGASSMLATEQKNAFGAVVDGAGNLYWANRSFPGEPDVGGIWTCATETCSTTTKLVTASDWPLNPVFGSDGLIYFPEGNGSTVRRVQRDGGNLQILAEVNTPFSLAVDEAHIYVISNQTQLLRFLRDGGSGTSVASIGSEYRGYITSDDLRFYWADTTGGVGHVHGALKATPSSRIEYGTGNLRPSGVAVDATHIYWADDGTQNAGVSNGDGRLLSCLKTGCVGPPTVLAQNLHFGGAIALDDTHVYYVEFGSSNTLNGALWKVRKPQSP